MKTSSTRTFAIHLALGVMLCGVLHAQVPQLVNYQGRVAVGTVNFNGSGQFKFALVNAAGTTTYWSNDGSSTAGSQPTAAVSLTVTKGLYSVLLGDTALANMTAIPASVWANADVRLRVWFNDGTNGFQLLTPDQRLAPNGYLPDAAVTTAKIASGAVDTAQIAGAAVTNVKLAAGSVGTNKLADGAVTTAKIGSGAVGTEQLAAGALGTPVTVGGAAQTMVANTSYTATGAAQTAFTLPSTANVGDTVQVSATGAGGWSVAPGSGQSYVGLWTPHESNRGWQSVASSADGSKLVAVVGGSSGGQIYTSTDSGVSWTARESNRNWWSVASSADGSKLVAVVDGGQIYTSTDSGVTWTARMTDANRGWFSVASSADGSKLVAVENGGQIYTSTDSGASWTTRESSRFWRSVASSADGIKLVAVVNGGQIYTSTNAGANWTARESNRDWVSVASSADGSKLVAVVNGGQIYTSTNSGANWTAHSTDPNNANTTRNWLSVASSSDGSKLVAVVRGGQIYTSTDSGANWTARESSRTWWSVTSSADGSRLVAVDHGGQIYTSAPSGAAGSSATLQYLGNGEWTALTPASPLPFGSVGSAQLAPLSVTSSAIVDRSVTEVDIAFNTITNSNIAGNAGISATKLGTGAVDNTEFGYLDGVTSGIQGQFDTLTTNLGTTNTTVNGKVSKSGDTMTGTLTATGLTANSATNGSFGTPFFNQNASHAGLAVQIAGTGTYEPQMRFARADGQFYDIGMNGSNGFVIEDNDTARLTIDSNGHVGIGTTSPAALVTILTAPAEFGFEHRDTGGRSMATFVNGSGGWIGTTSNHPLNFYTNNSNEQMTLSTSGNLGIGTTAPAYQLQLSTDSAGKPNGGSWSNSSDRRLKQNIQPMEDALERLTRLRGVTFEWRNPEDHANQHGTQAGFIAQEVAAIFPNWVTQVDAAAHDRALTDNGKINSLTLPFEFDALVVESIKQQQAEIEEKDAKIAVLKKEIEALKAKDAAREKREQEREARLAKLEQFIPKEPKVEAKMAANTNAEH